MSWLRWSWIATEAGVCWPFEPGTMVASGGVVLPTCANAGAADRAMSRAADEMPSCSDFMLFID